MGKAAEGMHAERNSQGPVSGLLTLSEGGMEGQAEHSSAVAPAPDSVPSASLPSLSP